MKQIKVRIQDLHSGYTRMDSDCDGLKESIRANGLRTPLIVHLRDPEGFTVVDGNRRLLALQSLREEAGGGAIDPTTGKTFLWVDAVLKV